MLGRRRNTLKIGIFAFWGLSPAPPTPGRKRAPGLIRRRVERARLGRPAGPPFYRVSVSQAQIAGALTIRLVQGFRLARVPADPCSNRMGPTHSFAEEVKAFRPDRVPGSPCSFSGAPARSFKKGFLVGESPCQPFLVVGLPGSGDACFWDEGLREAFLSRPGRSGRSDFRLLGVLEDLQYLLEELPSDEGVSKPFRAPRFPFRGTDCGDSWAARSLSPVLCLQAPADRGLACHR